MMKMVDGSSPPFVLRERFIPDTKREGLVSTLLDLQNGRAVSVRTLSNYWEKPNCMGPVSS
jgi:hypothetical protein